MVELRLERKGQDQAGSGAMRMRPNIILEAVGAREEL